MHVEQKRIAIISLKLCIEAFDRLKSPDIKKPYQHKKSK